MRSCAESFAAYGLRSIGIGERRLPISDITLCDQVALIGGGMLWNFYFAALAVGLGFFFACLLALMKASDNPLAQWPASSFIFVFRGSPLFIQFFFVYELFVLLPKVAGSIDVGLFELSVETRWLTRAWLGALIVLFLNTSAYSAEIFYGALKSCPRGELEAADAYGMSRWMRFRRVQWPTMLRLGWPSYTNEALFLFHATTLVFFSSFPAWRQEGDALYYANYLAEKTFNPFTPYPIVAVFFVLGALAVLFAFGRIERRLNRHLLRGR